MRQLKLRFPVFLMLPMLMLLTSCDDDKDLDNAVQWEKIEFVNGGVIHSIYGNLDDYLLVSTISKILRTNDGGKTWETVLEVQNPIGEFQPLNGDIIAVANFKDYISHDQGLTWEEVEFDHDLNAPWSAFNDTKGTLYQIVAHYNGELALPTTVLRSVNKGNSWETIFPNKHLVYSWYIDNRDRVYLGVSGNVWDGDFFVEDPQFSAYLYYLKD